MKYSDTSIVFLCYNAGEAFKDSINGPLFGADTFISWLKKTDILKVKIDSVTSSVYTEEDMNAAIEVKKRI